MPKFGSHFVREDRVVFSFPIYRLKGTNTVIYSQTFHYIWSTLNKMKMKFKTLTYLLLLLFTYSCKNTASSEKINAITKDTVQTFRLPEVPIMFSSSDNKLIF